MATDELQAKIKALFADYETEAENAINEVIAGVAKNAAKELRKTSPKKTGTYSKGWTSKVEKTRIGVTGIVYNRDVPGLAHLLEFGHAKRNGGRTRSIPHVMPVYEWAAQEAATKIGEVLEK